MALRLVHTGWAAWHFGGAWCDGGSLARVAYRWVFNIRTGDATGVTQVFDDAEASTADTSEDQDTVVEVELDITDFEAVS